MSLINDKVAVRTNSFSYLLVVAEKPFKGGRSKVHRICVWVLFQSIHNFLLANRQINVILQIMLWHKQSNFSLRLL
jgi:hypothetical protein